MRITKQHIVKEIRKRYPSATCEIGKTALGKGMIEIECNHGDCQRIGQFVLGWFPKQIFTYYACHAFRKGHLSVYFRK